jgi:hypothetical protein
LYGRELGIGCPNDDTPQGYRGSQEDAMGIRSISIINEGLPFLAHTLNKGLSPLLTRVCEEKQLRGAGARNRKRTHFRSWWKLIQDNVEQIR